MSANAVVSIPTHAAIETNGRDAQRAPFAKSLVMVAVLDVPGPNRTLGQRAAKVGYEPNLTDASVGPKVGYRGEAKTFNSCLGIELG